MSKQTQDIKKRYIAPVVASLVTVVFMGAVIRLLIWEFHVDPAGAPPLPLRILLLAIPAVVIVGVLVALAQRMREIQRNEEDDAKQY